MDNKAFERGVIIMAEYYLISQLPSLDAIGENSPIPITQEQFLELCNRFLNKNLISSLILKAFAYSKLYNIVFVRCICLSVLLKRQSLDERVTSHHF